MTIEQKEDLSLKRLRWGCRRGMLELDLLLLPFFDTVYPSLASADQQEFARLLEEPDPKILFWLMGKEEPDHEFTCIIEIIRGHLSSLD